MVLADSAFSMDDLSLVSAFFCEEFEEKCESTGEAGVSGVCIMSSGQLVPWE